jgi:DNA uptake protein ComE-like DNA-binding protein
MRLRRLVGEQLAGSLEIVFGDEDLAPAAEVRASEDPSRRDVGVAVEAVDALAAEETAKSLSRAFVRNNGQSHRFCHTFIITFQPRNGPLADRPASGPVHLNSATVEQLDELPGIGPVTTELRLPPTAL